MRFTLSWLKRFINLNLTASELAEKLTQLGHEVEEITNSAEALEPFIIAEIKEATPHPDADKLRCCQVYDGKQMIKIVCGAANARAGIKVVLAPLGTKIPTNGMVIKAATIRGQESCGMLCSAAELGLEAYFEDADTGIIELPSNAPVGEKFASTYGYDDPVLELKITPNRGDCLSVYGIARELAAVEAGELIADPFPELSSLRNEIAKTKPAEIPIKLEHEGCTQFAAGKVENLTAHKTPEWMQRQLIAIGERSISLVVDITNYLMFSYGQPLHAYDANKITDLTVRQASQDEPFKALDSNEYKLNSEVMVVSSKGKAVAIAGVIGSEESGCQETTNSIILEAAHFTAEAVIKSGRQVNINTSSRYRFERHVDHTLPFSIAQLALAMIAYFTKGKASGVLLVGSNREKPEVIKLNKGHFAKLTGLNLELAMMPKLLERLGCIVTENNNYFAVIPPTWRPDLILPEDLIEELLRLHGYDNLPTTKLSDGPETTHTNLSYQRKITTQQQLSGRGLYEVVTWSMNPVITASRYSSGVKPITLANPIRPDLAAMRPTIIHGLLEVLLTNIRRGIQRGAWFEVGPVYSTEYAQLQTTCCTWLRAGNVEPRNHYGERQVDFFDVKADLEALVVSFGLNPEGLTWQRLDQLPAEQDSKLDLHNIYHPTRSSGVKLGKKLVAVVGELHPALLAEYGIKTPAVAAELWLDTLPQAKVKSASKPPLTLNNFPVVKRDFAFIINRNQEIGRFIKAIAAVNKQVIKQVNVFDIYSDEQLASNNEYSVALEVTLAADHTLTEVEINQISDEIVARASEYDARLRN